MAEIYRLPAISPTMDLGTIVAWRLSEGDAFEAGAVIAEIGTDKATMEAEIFEEGVLLKQLVSEDDEVPVNAPMAIVGEAGEDVDDLVAEAKAELEEMIAKATSDGGDDSADDAPSSDDTETEDDAETEDEADEQDASAAPAEPRPSSPPPEVSTGDLTRRWEGRELPIWFQDTPGDLRAATTTQRVLASPLARKVAADLGVDLHRVKGSGPGGRIVKADVETAPTGGTSRAAGPVPDDETIKLSPMRKTIAKRLLASHQDIPTFYLTVEFDMTNMVALRGQLKAGEIKVSYNDLVVAAAGRALREYPAANASWHGKTIVRHGNVDVGVAVAVDGGLITPVIRGADRLDVAEIGRQTRELAAKAREGTLEPAEYEGNTFTISNLGMFGIHEFTAIINPPASAILAVGGLEQRPVVVDGELAVGWRMSATLTCDHRVLDGAVGAEFLQVLRRYVENPALILV